MGWSHGQHWTIERIEEHIKPIAARLGRMPSMSELRQEGRNDLAVQLGRGEGGMSGWASRLGVAMKDSETTRGHRWEVYVLELLRDLGRTVERQTTRAPFDLLVDGRCRVNVKSAALTRQKTGPPGFHFGINKSWQHCDVFALVRSNVERPVVLWVPSREWRRAMIHLTPSHRFNSYVDVSVIDREFMP